MLEEDFLRHVFRGGPVAEKMVRDAEHHCLVLLYESSEVLYRWSLHPDCFPVLI
jgi:hypothetical protein